MRDKKKQRKILLIFIIGFIFIYSGFKILVLFRQSYFLKTPNRINILFYGPKTSVISIGLADKVNYLINFDHDMVVYVVGGYKNYRIGSIGKIADLEKDPDLVARSFSHIISAEINAYFIEKKIDIYHHKNEQTDNFSKSRIIIDQIFNYQYKSDLNFLDKIYLSIKILNLYKPELIELKTPYQLENNNKVFSVRGFSRRYAGFFYHQSLREEEANIKIYYNNYQAAKNFSQVLEGQGIRVVDLELNDKIYQGCRIYVDRGSEEKYHDTIEFITDNYNCQIKNQDTKGANIAIIMGSELNHIWQ